MNDDELNDAPFPHCDSAVLHAPGKCEYCDLYPSAQERRIANGINFTGEQDPAKKPCPATILRMNEELVMYLIFRADLNMPKGKIAAQAGHAVQLCLLAIRNVARKSTWMGHLWLREWEGTSYTKVALKVDDLKALGAIQRHLHEEDILYAQVIDEGRTVVEKGTITCIAIQPMPKSLVQHIVGGLKLL